MDQWDQVKLQGLSDTDNIARLLCCCGRCGAMYEQLNGCFAGWTLETAKWLVDICNIDICTIVLIDFL